MNRYLKYFLAVWRHKRFVYKACRQFKVPLLSALWHDADKFYPDEFFPYANTFYDKDGNGQYKESIEFAKAWMLHQHRNKHHWQYWLVTSSLEVPLRKVNIIVWDRGIVEQIIGQERTELPLEMVKPLPMSDSARKEMISDWFGAGRAYNKDWTPLEPRKWYEKNKDKIILHPETRAWVEAQLLAAESTYRI